MKSNLKYKVLSLLLIAGSMLSCTHQVATVATLPDGLYFLSDSLADTQVVVADRFGEKGYTIVDKQAILHLKDTKVDFQYDVKVYADSFGIVYFTTHQDWSKLWQAKQKATVRGKVGLVIKDELIGWNYSDDFARSRSLTICYCDWSKEELKIIEKHINNSQELGSSLAAPDSASKRQAGPISYHPKAYQEQVEDMGTAPGGQSLGAHQEVSLDEQRERTGVHLPGWKYRKGAFQRDAGGCNGREGRLSAF